MGYAYKLYYWGWNQGGGSKRLWRDWHLVRSRWVVIVWIKVHAIYQSSIYRKYFQLTVHLGSPVVSWVCCCYLWDTSSFPGYQHQGKGACQMSWSSTSLLQSSTETHKIVDIGNIVFSPNECPGGHWFQNVCAPALIWTQRSFETPYFERSFGKESLLTRRSLETRHSFESRC